MKRKDSIMLKYIVIDEKEMIIFPPTLQHRDIARDLCVTSAGFIEDGKCYGQSDSLGIGYKESDNKLLKLIRISLALK